jgi:5-methylcytosine-specific restriction endonuclease McrA
MAKRDYVDPVYKAVRVACMKRDKNKCQMPECRSKKSTKKHVHHVETWSNSPSLRFEINNCVLLCKICHDSIKGKESFYAPLFHTIILEKLAS